MKSLQGIYGFFKKYRIFHIIFWLWLFTSLYHDYLYRMQPPPTRFQSMCITLNTVLWDMGCIYLIIYGIVPRYFDNRKYGKLIFSTLATIFVFSFLVSLCEDGLDKLLYNRRLNSYPISMISVSMDMIMFSMIFFVFITIPRMYTTDQRNKLLEKERLETELNFLKSQINPHFLFNALNSIYVLIEEDKKLATETLLKFSDMLRYQLYDCSEQKMSIGKELAFLSDYAALEKIRNNEHLHVTFDIPADIASLQIPPFLLLPFIENAFKHISHHTDTPNYINICFALNQEALTFSVVNSYDAQPMFPQQQGGIGLQNVKRRLELLYPGRHMLDVSTHDSVYSVKLILEINDNEMYTGRRRAIGKKGYRKVY